MVRIVEAPAGKRAVLKQMNGVILTDYLGRKVRFTTERRQHILKYHPEMREWVARVREVLAQPDRVVRSRSDPETELFYVWQTQTRVGPKYLCVVVVVKDSDAFILTAYLTDIIKKGAVLWPKNDE